MLHSYATPIFRALVAMGILVMILSLTAIASDDRPQAKSDLPPIEVNYPKEPHREKLYDLSIIADQDAWGNLNVHDPSVYKDGDTYYVFSTDASVANMAEPGIQVRKSHDLIHWEYIGRAFDGVPEKAGEWTGATGLWAPDLTKIGDAYYLYYAASSFGKNRSFIGVARSKNIEGPWEDLGEVVKTDFGDPVNAIDPNVVYDEGGELWLSYGSFWSGIYILKLDKNSWKPSGKGFGKQIACRNSMVQGAIEGPYIIYNPEFRKYYLFVSYDSLFKDYNVRVGRADSIEGPYLDSNGIALTDLGVNPYEAGNKILGGYRFGAADGWIGPGHNSVLRDGKDYYILHHARGDQDTNWFYLQVRKILWSADGWPLVSPERYAGEKEAAIPGKLIPGTWDIIILVKYDNSELPSEPVKLLADGKINDGSGKSDWRYTPARGLILNLYNRDVDEMATYTCRVLPSWDWENHRPTLVFTGIAQNGEAIWGKKQE